MPQLFIDRDISLILNDAAGIKNAAMMACISIPF